MSVKIIKKSANVGVATPTKSFGDYASDQGNTNTNNCDIFNPSFEEASKFLSLLAPEDAEFTLQTFDDNSDRKAPSLTHIFQGSLEKYWDELVKLNRKGAGIFITVNKTDGKGRKKENIIGIRAIWQEADNGDEPELPCKPHIVVESSLGKYHRYILTKGPETGCLAEFESIQQRMVDAYGSDPNAKDRARVLRLPGFYHQKVNAKKCLDGTPYMVKITSTLNAPPSPWEKVKKLFPPVSKKNKVVQLHTAKAKDKGFQLGLYDRVLGALKHLNPDTEYEGWLKVGMAIHASFPSQAGLDIWINWSIKGNKFQQGVCEEKWSSFNFNDGGVE